MRTVDWLVALAATAAWNLALSTPTTAKEPTCAYVDVSPIFGNEPKSHCTGLDITCGSTDTYGCFKYELRFTDGWIEEPGQPRRRALAEPFGFIDPDGKHWDVPAGFVTDGASIPLFFRVFIGGPWTQNYIKAAVVHDFYIRRQSVSAQSVHDVFYQALLASGTPRGRARQMHFAVLNFGPSWKHVDAEAYLQLWQARKAMNDNLVQLHKEMWDSFQESERRRQAQEAIDREVVSRPLPRRTSVFVIPESGDAIAAYDAFVEAAARDHIVHLERDATLLDGQRTAVLAELTKPPAERTNVFLLQFTLFGATSGSFQARNDEELRQLVDLSNQFTAQQEAGMSSGPQ